MRPVSARFLAAVASSHRMVSRARVCSPGQNGTNPTGTEILMESGHVTLDSTADVRGTLDLTTAQSWPLNASDLLTPYGNEIFVERGVIYGDGSREWVSQGYYRINQVEQQDAPYGSIDVTCTDRMQGIKDARLTTPVVFNPGVTIISVIQQLVLDAYPWAVFDYDASLGTATLASRQTTDEDRFGFLNDLVTAQGMVWYWDYRGILYIHPAPNPAVPIAVINSGQNGVLVKLSRTLNRDGIYNGCVAGGQDTGTGAVASALVVDSNPSSPTYWYGPFGKVPQFFNSSFLTTDAQCRTAGLGLLQKSTGLPYNVDFGFVPNPALEPLDPVIVRYPQQGLAHTKAESHVISSLEIPLDAGTEMSGKTRQLVNGVFS